MNIELRDGLTQDEANAMGRRTRNGVEVEESRRIAEVLRLFDKYAQRATTLGGATELREERDEWNEEQEVRSKRREGYASKATVKEEVLDSVIRMRDHFGADVRVEDAVGPRGELGFGASEWSGVRRFRKPDGQLVVMLWNLDRRGKDCQEGRSLSGDQTWNEAVQKVSAEFHTYHRWFLEQDDRVEEAALRLKVISHVLRAKREGKLGAWKTERAEAEQAEIDRQEASREAERKRADERADHLADQISRAAEGTRQALTDSERAAQSQRQAIQTADQKRADHRAAQLLAGVERTADKTVENLTSATQRAIAKTGQAARQPGDEIEGEAKLPAWAILLPPSRANDSWGPLVPAVLLAMNRAPGVSRNDLRAELALVCKRHSVFRDHCQEYGLDPAALSLDSLSRLKKRAREYGARKRQRSDG